MNFLNTLIKPIHAADIDVGNVTGIGPYGFENTDITKQTVGSQFGNIISNVITALSVVGGLAFVIFFTLGGLKWLTAGGDKSKVQEAQQQMTQGVIGLVAVVASLFVVGIVGSVLGIDILNPFKTLFGNVQ
ncbi:MAG TPA: pilin [Candidatus Woesebacteria bacterium]|nr:pilin [Candidatus Woesebacteria bacterium]